MNGLRVIDAHVHFWNPNRLQYPWLSGVPSLQREFGPEHFDALTENALGAVLFVEANCESSEADAELDLVDELAAREPRIVGSIAFLDVTDDGLNAARLDKLARRQRVVGVRHNVQGQSAGYCLTSSFIESVRALEGRDLPFDLCVTPDQLDDAIALVRGCPNVRFVLDHCGKPSICTDAFAAWAPGIAQLAELENVACKVSGLFSEARLDQRNVVALRPYVEHVRRCFGAERLLYGSDWPVVTLAGGEAAWRATVHELTDGWSTAERQMFFSENAIRHYGLHRHVTH